MFLFNGQITEMIKGHSGTGDMHHTSSAKTMGLGEAIIKNPYIMDMLEQNPAGVLSRLHEANTKQYAGIIEPKLTATTTIGDFLKSVDDLVRADLGFRAIYKKGESKASAEFYDNFGEYFSDKPVFLSKEHTPQFTKLLAESGDALNARTSMHVVNENLKITEQQYNKYITVAEHWSGVSLNRPHSELFGGRYNSSTVIWIDRASLTLPSR